MTRHVFMAGDLNVLKPLLVTVYSLSVHVQPKEYTVTVVVTGDERAVDHARAAVTEATADLGLTVNILQALPTFGQCLPTVRRITSSTFTRMEMDRYLPLDAHRALYVDTDAVFTGDPHELFELPLDGYFAAAVHDRWTPVDVRYFNAGVMMVNLDAWRAESVSSQVVEQDLTSRRVSDQDVLNHVFGDRWLEVNGVFNFVPGVANHVELPEFIRRYMHGRRDVRIVHFAGRRKPWLPKSRVRCRAIYDMYAQRRVDLTAQRNLLDIYTRWATGDLA